MISNFWKIITELIPQNNRIERIWMLAKVDFKNRYYDSKLGIVWALINPLFRLCVFYYVFTILFTRGTDNFVLHLFSGLVVWLFFVETTKKSLTLFKQKKYLIANISFDKLDLYYSSLLSGFFGFIFNFFIYLIFTLFFSIEYTWNIVWFPFIILNLLMICLGLSLILSTLSLYLRDLTHLWDLFIMLGFWASPIIYSEKILIDKAEFLVKINPIAGILINVRRVLLNASEPHYFYLIYNLIFASLILSIGFYLYRKHINRAVELL